MALTWVTLLGLPKERPDPVELINHPAQGRLLLDNSLPVQRLLGGLSLRGRPCVHRLAAQISLATAARLLAKGGLPPFPLRHDAEVVGKLHRLEAESTPGDATEKIQAEAWAGSWGRRSAEMPDRQWRSRRSKSGSGTEKSSLPMTRSICRRPSPLPADNDEDDTEGFVTSAATKNQCHRLKVTPQYAEHRRCWAEVWSLPCLARPRSRR